MLKTIQIRFQFLEEKVSGRYKQLNDLEPETVQMLLDAFGFKYNPNTKQLFKKGVFRK